MSDASTQVRTSRVADRNGRWVDVEHGATRGAMVGRDLYDQEGKLIASLIAYVRAYCTAKDVRKINGIPVERIISRNGTLVVKEIATEAIQAGDLGALVNITGGGIQALAGGNALLLGAGFGTGNDLVQYFGPAPASLAAADKASATYYLDAAGNAYFGGTLSAAQVQTQQLNATGENLLPNSSFMGNVRGAAVGPSIAAGSPLCDGWRVQIDSGARSTNYANCDVSYSGSAIRCRCYGTTPIPAGVTIQETACPIGLIDVTAGKTYELGFVTAGNTSNGSTPVNVDIRQRITVRWFDNANSQISYQEVAAALTRASTSAVGTVIAPAGATRAQPAVELLIKNNNATAWDVSAIGGTVLANVFFTQVWMRKRDELRVSGSGEQIGDQRNLPQILTNNYGAVRTATALSATSAGAISVNAHTVRMGSFSVSYNAVASAITGKAAGTSWIVYCTDADYSGGTKTWSAISSALGVANLGDGIYVAGSITIPSSGTSSGGGGGTDTGYCVDADAWLAPGLRARDAQVGDVLEVLDLPNAGLRRFDQAITGLERAWTERVRLVTDEGAELELAADTPCDLVDGVGDFTGERCNAAAMLGRWVVTDWGLERVAVVEPLGGGWVVRIHVDGYTYPAGSDPEHRIFTHNPLKP